MYVKDSGRIFDYGKYVFVVHDDLKDCQPYIGYGTVYDISKYNGKIYLASNGGVYYIDGKYVKKVTGKRSFDIDVVDDKLWMAGNMGVAYYDGKSIHVVYDVKSRAVLVGGNTVYSGSYTYGFFIINGVSVSSCPTHIWDIEKVGNSVYIATDGYGVERYVDGSCHSVASLSGYARYAKDVGYGNGKVYIVTSGGQFVLQNGK